MKQGNHGFQRRRRVGRAMGQGKLRALTLWRPWTDAILYGGKRIENRPWKPWKSVIGQLIAIHAGTRYDFDSARAMIDEGLYTAPGDACSPKGIVGLARVTGYVEKSDLFKSEENHDTWFSGPFGWKLTDVVAFEEAIACPGKQGLWRVEGPLLEQVRAAWKVVRS